MSANMRQQVQKTKQLFDQAEMATPADLVEPAEVAVVPSKPAAIAAQYANGVAAIAAQYANAPITSIPGFEEFDRSDVTLPRRKIVQGTTRNVDATLAGQFYDTVGETAKKVLHAVPLRYSHTRAMFTDGDFTDKSLICASRDGRVPRSDIAQPANTVCEGCPYAQWGQDGAKPACAAGYTFLMLDADEDDAPFMVTFAGTAIKAARKLISAVALKKRPLYTFFLTMTTEMQQDNRGKWYAPKFQIGDNPGDIGRYVELYAGYKAVVLDADEEAVTEAVDAEAGEEAAPF